MYITQSNVEKPISAAATRRQFHCQSAPVDADVIGRRRRFIATHSRSTIQLISCWRIRRCSQRRSCGGSGRRHAGSLSTEGQCNIFELDLTFQRPR